MARIVRSARSRRDADRLWEYVAERDGETRADSLLRSIEHTLATLARQPLLGKLRDELRTGLRCFPAGNYLIFYMPGEDGIYLARILHGARDIDAGYFDDEADAL